MSSKLRSAARIGLAIGWAAAACAQAQQAATPPDDNPPAANPPQAQQLKPVEVEGRPWLYNSATRYAHSLPEVDGATINVTKKASVEQLDEQPTVIDNNQRELFDRLPGIIIAEQQNPTELNLSYRGIGNPQESEYILSLQDGIPIASDLIGFPPQYYIPVPQSIAAIQMIRGGSGLLYGPEPQPVINYVSRQADPAHRWSGYAEQVGGSGGLYSSFDTVSGSSGAWSYLADFAHRRAGGQRINGSYVLDSGDLRLGYRLDATQTLGFDLHAYATDSGIPGFQTYQQFRSNPYYASTPDDHRWVDRYTGVLHYDNDAGPALLSAKLWFGQQDLVNRNGTYTGTVASTAPGSTTLDDQRFQYLGLDLRLRLRWARANALTFGVTGYASRAPWQQFSGANPLVDEGDHSGTLSYSNDRSTRYAAVFAENVFRCGRFHVVPSVRYDFERLRVDENVFLKPPFISRAPIDTAYSKGVPLFALGLGNDFGHGNETYLNIAQGYRPQRYLDVASPFGNFSPGNNPNPTKYLTYEIGVHGWPRAGLYYDVSLFEVKARDRIESENVPNSSQTVDVNSGDTRSRGAELEGDFDLLRWLPQAPQARHLDLFANASLLQASFTHSVAGLAGSTPSYAPHYVFKAGTTLRRDCAWKLSLVAMSVGAQFWQDSDQGLPTAPARIPQYTVLDLSGDWWLLPQLRLLGGISNLADRRYYSRVFPFVFSPAAAPIEPADGRRFYAGLSLEL